MLNVSPQHNNIYHTMDSTVPQLLVHSNCVRKHEQFKEEKKHSSFLTEAERGPVSIKRGGNS